jgi:hypothetical protein
MGRSRPAKPAIEARIRKLRRHPSLATVRCGTASCAALHMLPSLLRQRGKRRGIVVGEVFDIGVAEQKFGKGPGGLAWPHDSRGITNQVARVLLSRHTSIASSILAPPDRSRDRPLGSGLHLFERNHPWPRSDCPKSLGFQLRNYHPPAATARGLADRHPFAPSSAQARRSCEWRLP